jgi:hypothetical protein
VFFFFTFMHLSTSFPAKSSKQSILRRIGSDAEHPRLARGRRRFLGLTAAVLLAVTGGAGTAQASTEVFNYNTNASTTRTFQGGMVSGVTYKTLSSPITFNSLGFIDIMDNPPGDNFNYYYNPDGLHGSYEVGIWINSTPGILLASTVVTTDSTVIGNFRYAPIPTTTIPANTDFTIAALLPADLQDAWLYSTQTLNSPDIMGVGGGRTILDTTTLAFPSGPGFGIASTAIVNASDAVVAPEPTSAVLLLLAGGGFGLLRRRRG